jgi:hypothetical protein
MDYSIVFLCAAATPGTPSHEVADAKAHRCEAILLRAIKVEDSFLQRCLVLDSIDQFSRYKTTMSSVARKRIGFLAGVLLQTSTSWDSRLCMVWIYRELPEKDAIPGFGAILQLLEDAEMADADGDKLPRAMEPTVRGAPMIEGIVERYGKLFPSYRMAVDRERPTK